MPAQRLRPEFVSKAPLSWALIEPGKPWQNGVTESFNGKFRDECLSLEWFRSRAEAKVIIEGVPTAFEPRLPHAERVRGARNKASAPPGNGPGRCGTWVSAVAQPSTRGQMQSAREAVSS